MNRKVALFNGFCISLLSATAAHAESQQNPVPSMPERIFDGRTLTGWNGNDRYWHIEDGAITGEVPRGQKLDHNEFLYWKGEVGDFDLTLEFRIMGGPEANSGIQYRTERLPDGAAVGYQADIDAGGPLSLGQIYEERGRGFIALRGTHTSIAADGCKKVDPLFPSPDFTKLFKAGDWNTYRVTVKGSHAELRVNGELTVVLDDQQREAARLHGLLAFQLHQAPGPQKVQFRNIQLVRLGQSVAAQ